MSLSKDIGDIGQDAVLTSSDSPPLKPNTNKDYSDVSPPTSGTSISPNATPRKASASVTSPDSTPRKNKRTFIFSSAFRPPLSRRTDNYNGPRLDPEQLAAHAFDPPSADYDYRDRIKAPNYADPYYRALQDLPITPTSDTSLQFDSPSWCGSEPELSTGSDATEISKSLLPADLLDSVFHERIQSEKSTSEDTKHAPVRPAYIRESIQTRSPTVFQQRSPMYTPPGRVRHRSSPPIFLSDGSSHYEFPEATSTASESAPAPFASQFLRPPVGTFRSSHAHRLRSESQADARERAKAALAKKRVRRVRSDTMSKLLQGPAIINSKGCDNRKNNNERVLRNEKHCDDDYVTDSQKDMEDIVLGISELDIFGVGIMRENMDRRTSTPWKRSVRAPPILNRFSDDSFDEGMSSNDGIEFENSF